MIKYENECVDCGLQCLGKSCPNRNVKIYECDDCHDEVENLYEYNGMELCIDCVEKLLSKVN